MPSDTETCRSAILSEDVRDFIGNDVRTAFFDGISGQTLCSQDAGFGYSCLYLPAAAADPITLSRYSYDSIPKCYAPADMQTLNQAGILPVQNYPTLQLRGRGVLDGLLHRHGRAGAGGADRISGGEGSGGHCPGNYFCL